MSQTLLIKYATRSRPQRMFSVLDSIFSNADNPSDLCVLLSLDKDDITVYNQKVLNRLKPYLEKYNIKAYFSDRKTKIEAFNRDIDKITNWKYLLHLTDFTEICQKGFDTELKLALDDHKCSASFESINSNGTETNNIHVIKKVDYDKFGYLYNPKLKANFEEEELEYRLMANVKFKDFTESIHRYVHPRWLYLNPDKLLVHNIKFWQQDLETFEKLRNEG